MGKKSEIEEPGSASFESMNDTTGGDLDRRPVESDRGGDSLDEVWTSPIFELDWENPGEMAKNYKIPKTPDEKLRFIEFMIENCVTEWLE